MLDAVVPVGYSDQVSNHIFVRIATRENWQAVKYTDAGVERAADFDPGMHKIFGVCSRADPGQITRGVEQNHRARRNQKWPG